MKIDKNTTPNALELKIKNVFRLFGYIPKASEIINCGSIVDAVYKEVENQGLISIQYAGEKSYAFYDGHGMATIIHSDLIDKDSFEHRLFNKRFENWDSLSLGEQQHKKNICFLNSLSIALEPESHKDIVKSDDSPAINDFAYEVLMDDLHGYPQILESMKKYFKINSLKYLPESELTNARLQIKKIKRNCEDIR